MPWGGTRRGSANSWLGNKPRSSALLSTPATGSSAGKGKGRGGASFFEGSSFAADLGDEDVVEEQQPQQKTATPQSKGKGKGRGSSSFFQGGSFAEDADEVGNDASTASPSFSSGKGRGKGRGRGVGSAPESAPPPPQASKRKVPGLDGAMSVADLDDFAEAAHRWCEEQGAANLTEVTEFFVEFAEALGLRPLQKRRLWSVIAGSKPAPKEIAAPILASQTSATVTPKLPSSGSGAKVEEAKEALASAMWGGDAEALMQAISLAEKAGLEAGELEEARALLLDDTRPRAAAQLKTAIESSDVVALREAIDFAAKVGFSGKELQQAQQLLDAASAAAATPPAAKAQPAAGKKQREDAPVPADRVPGLRAVLQKAGLAQHIEAAMSWCEEAGAAHMDEVMECKDELAEELGLSDEEHRNFEVVLEGGELPAAPEAEVDAQKASPSAVDMPPAPDTVDAPAPDTSEETTSAVPSQQEPDDQAQEVPGDGKAAASVACRVKGLADVLRAAGFEARIAEVDAWCDEAGAAHIDEVIESIDDIAEALAFSDEERDRLLAHLAGDTKAPAGEANAEVTATGTSAAQEVAATSTSTSPEVTDAPSLAAAGAEADDAASASQALRVKGLADAMRAVGLGAKLARAAEWCEEEGAATLDEVSENLDDFAEGIELSEAEKDALRAVLPEA